MSSLCMRCGRIVNSVVNSNSPENIAVCTACYDDIGESMAMDAYYGVDLPEDQYDYEKKTIIVKEEPPCAPKQ